MNKIQTKTMRAMLIVSAGLVVLLHINGIVKEIASMFLTFLAIFAFFYGLGLLGAWGMLYRFWIKFMSMLGRMMTYTRTAVKSKTIKRKAKSEAVLLRASKKETVARKPSKSITAVAASSKKTKTIKGVAPKKRAKRVSSTTAPKSSRKLSATKTRKSPKK